MRVDDIDISKVTLHSLRSQMGVMMQDSFIFSGTIMDNIRYGKQDGFRRGCDPGRKNSLRPRLYHADGGRLSDTGQRTGQPPLRGTASADLLCPGASGRSEILILDEATSSIDTETEIALQKGLNELLKGRTSFIIAHRLSTIKNCDTILYVDKGNIQERGNHQELLRLKGAYLRPLYVTVQLSSEYLTAPTAEQLLKKIFRGLPGKTIFTIGQGSVLPCPVCAIPRQLPVINAGFRTFIHAK